MWDDKQKGEMTREKFKVYVKVKVWLRTKMLVKFKTGNVFKKCQEATKIRLGKVFPVLN
jgi:hypothetical protein